MGKTRAEIQRAYRDRQKEKNKEAFLQKERERKRRNYVPSDQLSEKDREVRNKRNRANLREFYARKKAMRTTQVRDTSETSSFESNASNYEHNDSQSNESKKDRNETDVSRGRIRVKLNFNSISEGKRKAALKRWKRDRSAAQSRIRLLEQERDKLKTKLKSTQRSLQRLKRDKIGQKAQELTPSKQTERDMTAAKLNNDQKAKLRLPLLLSNVISSEIKEAKKTTPRHKMKALHNIVAGKIAKKYKCVRYLSVKTGFGRRQLGKAESKVHQLQPSKRHNKMEKYRHEVIRFLQREDNSRMQPGKNDAKRLKKGVKVQVQILTDYLKNLYLKFKAEHPEIHISFATFCRSRPNYIYKTSMTSRISCLCLKHQNAALTVKSLRRHIEVTANPETVSTNIPNRDILNDKLPEQVTFSQWTRVETEEKGRKKSVTRIVEKTVGKAEFIEHFESQMKDFREHVDRVHVQYEQLKTLKEKLPMHHMIVQLDFAENYTCRSHEEVQSAYFNQTSVTLHPQVAYWKTDDGSLMHKSFVTVSDEMSHKSSTVLAFLDDLIPELNQIDPHLDTIHYWSDSPSSQYRNKYMLDAIANHKSTYGCYARWNYFESGHGKGPCDGLGGTSKRMADEASRSGKHVICDAKDFHQWATSSTMKNVTFRFVSQDACADKAKAVAERQVRPVSGTMRLHAVVGRGDSKILIRNTSCYCAECLDGVMCQSWTDARTHEQNNPQSQSSNVTERSKSPRNAREVVSNNISSVGIDEPKTLNTDTEDLRDNQVEYKEDDFVAAVYERAWYIGKIVDSDMSEVEINFMEKKKSLFQWPSYEDKIWVNKSDILCTIPPPMPTGKSGRLHKMNEDTINTIVTLFERFEKP